MLLKTIEEYEALGMRTLPCGLDKRPLVNWSGWRDWTTEKRLETWEQYEEEEVLVGACPGDYLVIDVDNWDRWIEFKTKMSWDHLPPSPVTCTPRGGFHFWFVCTDEHFGKGERQGLGFDWRHGLDGYVIVPGPFGEWTWGARGSIKDIDTPKLPDEIRAYLRSETQHTHKVPVREAPPDGAPIVYDDTRDHRIRSYMMAVPHWPGGRNKGAHQIAVWLINDMSAEPEEAWNYLQIWNDRATDPLEEHEMQSVLKSVQSRGGRRVRGCALTSTAKKPENDRRPFTDLGNAERLIDHHGENIMYSAERKMWMMWDGLRWIWDKKHRIRELVNEVVRSIREEPTHNDKDTEALHKHAHRSEKFSNLCATTSCAMSKVPVSVNELDANPWDLVVLNGTVDLQTGALRPSRREDLNTKSCATHYDPTAICPIFEKTLKRVQPDPETRLYIQKCLGYALTGLIREQALFIWHGSGSNGKSTIMTAAMELMGSYAKQAVSDLLIAKNNESHPTELADLMGARLIVASETEQYKVLRTAMVKQLTGGDYIKARYMRTDFFQFKPVMKVFLSTNHRPIIRDDSHAMWRRLKLAPWDVKITDEEMDGDLDKKLVKEWPGILRWLIAGCQLWAREGLTMPGAVDNATRTYKTDQDVLGDFFELITWHGDNSSINKQHLYDQYVEWAKDAGIQRPLSKRFFELKIKERYPHVETARRRDSFGARGYVWVGIELEDSKAEASYSEDT